MAKIHKSLPLVLITGFLITVIGCMSGNFPVSTMGSHDKSVENTASNVNNINQTSLNSMSSQQDSSIQNNNNDTSETNGPEIVDNLKSIEIENLNDENNSKVTLMLNADNQTYINQDDVEWIRMQGGLGITTKVLFAGHDDEKINRIVSMINSGTGKTESTEAEINVIHSRARPIGICFQLKDGNKAYVWTDYTTKTFKNGWSATVLNDRFILDIQNGGKDEYYTIFSKDAAEYLSEGWKADMPTVNKITVNSESGKNGEQNVIRDGDKAIVSGDGCTSKEVVIHLRRNGEPKEDYIIGKAIPVFGKWQWSGLITRQFKALDGKKATLAKDLYDIVADEDGAGIGVCGIIDLREQKQ